MLPLPTVVNEIHNDINSVESIKPDYSRLEKGWEAWGLGQRLGWLFLNDYYHLLKFSQGHREGERFDIWVKKYQLPYQGVLFTFPDRTFEIERNAVICVQYYPTVKELPAIEWITLNKLLENKNLYKVYKL